MSVKNTVRSTAIILALATTWPLLAQIQPAPVPFTSSCSAIAPAWIRGPSIQWLGSCVAGKADGLGVLRVGTRAPFAFLVGRMKAGKPASGLVFEPNGDYMDAMGFDSQGEVISPDGEHIPEQDRIWADAVKAANSVADRFAAVGNRASAAYYRKLAYKIENGRPE